MLVGMQRRILLALLVAFTASCHHSTLDTAPLDITLTATPTTVARGDTVTFVANAQGGFLIGIEIDFADGSTDQYGTSGAASAHVTFKHAYNSAGTFDVSATATDGSAGQRDANVQIIVN